MRKDSVKAQLGWVGPHSSWWSSLSWNYLACRWGNSSRQSRPLSRWASYSTRFFMVALTIFCGVTIPYPNLVHSWKLWVYQLNPFTRLLSAMLSTELHGLQIQCKPGEFAVFNPPPGQSCATWANEFVNAFGGYLDNPSDAQACRYCQYKVGDEYMTQLNMFYGNRWKDAWVIFAFFVLNFFGTIAASRFLRHTKR